MKDIRNIHSKAMELMRIARQKLENRDIEEYLAISNEALLLEKEAAFELVASYESEPTRSVLFRSAANLAYNVGDFELAERLIHNALSGYPHVEIKEELLSMKQLVENAVSVNMPKNELAEYSYINVIRENAINFKVEPKTEKYSKAVILDNIIDFLGNIQISYKNFAEVQFRKSFLESDFNNFYDSLNLFKKETKLLMVGLNFKSFGVSIVADTEIMNYKFDNSEKFTSFKKTIFENFKNDVLLADFNLDTTQKNLETKYNDEERNKIYTAIVNTLDDKVDYKVSISDIKFNVKIRDLKTLNKKTKTFLRPKIEKTSEGEKSLVIKKTLELTDVEGTKKQKLQTEYLTYAEFAVEINTIKPKNLENQIFFIEPYKVNIIFNENTFTINDTFFDVYIEEQDFKEIQRIYEETLISKYLSLSNRRELAFEEKIIFEKMTSTFLFS